MLSEIKHKKFTNGIVYALKTHDGFLVETTDTFLPYYTKDAVCENQNMLRDSDTGTRKDRWMIGVSVMSGCPVRCKFCATGTMKKWRNLTADEIIEQVDFVLRKRNESFSEALEHKINFTRMGEPFLNIENVKRAIVFIEHKHPNTHHYVSTIGVNGSDFSWIKDNITLQISLHSLKNDKRNWLIPYKHKLSIEELGKIRTGSHLKTTVNMTLVDKNDFSIDLLCKHFNKDHFFIKLSPINPNLVSDSHYLGLGAITGINLQ